MISYRSLLLSTIVLNDYGRHSKVSIHRIIGKQRRVYKVANLCSHITLWEDIQVTYNWLCEEGYSYTEQTIGSYIYVMKILIDAHK